MDPNIIKDYLLKRLAKKLDISQLFADMYRISEVGSRELYKEKPVGHGQPPNAPKVAYSIQSTLAQHVYSALLVTANDNIKY